ncbi:MAG: HAD family hydrolase [Candidatus Nanopelagicales bacterium]
MAEYLVSWTDGQVRKSIVDFVATVSDPESEDFVEPGERIATFDNDGTLWCEQPLAQGAFIAQRLTESARRDPSLAARQPWKALVEGNAAWIDDAVTKYYEGDSADVQLLISAALDAFGDVEVEEFERAAAAFLASARHPVYQRPYTELGFVPMVELVTYLKAHGFACYIVSGGGREFMRPVTAMMYGIPADRVIGTSSQLRFVADDAGARVMRTATSGILDDGPMKAIQIWERIGRRPILAAGNANGDVPMLQFATDQPGRTLGLLVHHDDATREVAYTRGAELALDAAGTHGWAVVSMARDWKQVFAHG